MLKMWNKFSHKKERTFERNSSGQYYICPASQQQIPSHFTPVWWREKAPLLYVGNMADQYVGDVGQKNSEFERYVWNRNRGAMYNDNKDQVSYIKIYNVNLLTGFLTRVDFLRWIIGWGNGWSGWGNGCWGNGDCGLTFIAKFCSTSFLIRWIMVLMM